jgi:Ni,Fe-hydrogenase I large subunit
VRRNILHRSERAGLRQASPARWPSKAKGVGFMEAPRAGPRDPRGQSGAYEAALAGRHRLVLPKHTLEIQRTIHSFDPCVACAAHVADPEGAVGGDRGELRRARSGR